MSRITINDLSAVVTLHRADLASASGGFFGTVIDAVTRAVVGAVPLASAVAYVGLRASTPVPRRPRCRKILGVRICL